MAKVACIKDFKEYAEMIGVLLEKHGHRIITAAPPVDWERILDFGPDLTVVGFFRKRAAYNRPLVNVEEDVLGLETMREIEKYPAISIKPVLVLGNGIEEFEIPEGFHYDAFLFFPDDMERLLETVDELALKVKTRRRISGYLCPVCGSRLTYTVQPIKDLFCPRCHTAVTLLDDHACIYLKHSIGSAIECSIDQLKAKRPGP